MVNHAGYLTVDLRPVLESEYEPVVQRYHHLVDDHCPQFLVEFGEHLRIGDEKSFTEGNPMESRFPSRIARCSYLL